MTLKYMYTGYFVQFLIFRKISFNLYKNDVVMYESTWAEVWKKGYSLFISLTNTFFPMKSISPSTHENFQRLTIILDAKRPQQRNLSVRLSAVKGVPLSSSRFLKHLYRTYHLTFEKKNCFPFLLHFQKLYMLRFCLLFFFEIFVNICILFCKCE